VPRWPGTDLFIVPDKGLDRVHVVRLDAEGVLEHVSGVAARAGSGPRHVAFDHGRATAWVCNELDSTVTTYRFDASSGQLRAQQVAPLLPPEYAVESRAAGIVAHGATVYVSNRGHDSVTVLGVDPMTGFLTPKQWVSTMGKTPRFLTLTPCANFLLVVNERSDTIVRCRVRDDGTLDEGKVVAATGSPVCVDFLPSTNPSY
jgi:6-phosphogluconolactonase (cycloisomerase 2 family)